MYFKSKYTSQGRVRLMIQAKGVKLTTENWSNTCMLNFLIMHEYNAFVKFGHTMQLVQVNEKSQHGHALSG